MDLKNSIITIFSIILVLLAIIIVLLLFNFKVTSSVQSNSEKSVQEKPVEYTYTMPEPKPMNEQEKFVSEEDGFAIDFSSKPTYDTNENYAWDIRTTTHHYSVEENGVIYGVSYTDLGIEFDEWEESDYIFYSMRDYLERVTDSQVTNEKEITINGYPGVEYYHITDYDKARDRFYLVDNQVYEVYVITTEDSVYTKEVNDYFDSFELI